MAPEKLSRADLSRADLSRADLSRAQARRIALAATGLASPRPHTGTADVRAVRKVVASVGLIQIDSVNVLQRAHYMPMWSRLGAYPTEVLDRAAYRRPRRLFEYWGHEASLLPVELYPLIRWRMERAHVWQSVNRIAQSQPKLLGWVRDEIAAGGPMTAAELEADVIRPSGNWGWNWSDVKILLEWLFWRGEVLVAGRTNSFARTYDVPERVLPPEVFAAPVPARRDALRELMRRSAASLGVANELELRDYYRLPVEAKMTIPDLVDDGTLIPVEIEGCKGKSYLHRDARIPGRVTAATLLSPFDPAVWFRSRAERLFDFTYRIEIYVPAHLRKHGYYVLPFLLGDRIVARVDLKADRAAGVLRVPGAFAEHRAPAHTASALAAELVRLAAWLGLGRVEPPERGDLAGALATALRAYDGPAA